MAAPKKKTPSKNGRKSPVLGDVLIDEANENASKFKINEEHMHVDKLNEKELEESMQDYKYFIYYKQHRVITLYMLAFLYFYEINLTIGYACSKLGISRQTIWNWTKKNKIFENLVLSVRDNADEEMLDIAESKLLENVREGKEPSVMFLLERRGRHRGYGKIETNMDVVVEEIEFEEITDEEFKKIQAE